MTISQIKRMRLAHEIPQAELCRLAGLQQARLCNAERGNVTLKDAELTALTEAMRSAIQARRQRAERDMQALNEFFAQCATP